MRETVYTLENIQVDCSKLIKEQIKEMCKVFETNGFEIDEKRINVSAHTFTFLRIDGNDVWCSNYDENKTTITYEKFMELFSPKYEVTMIAEQPKEELTESSINKRWKQVRESYEELLKNPPKAYKEISNKLNYELDFNFITQLAERMNANKGKYEPYNWQKLDNIEDLKQALFRHVMEVMKGNYEDDKRAFGHLEAIALNCMFINYQLNNGNENM